MCNHMTIKKISYKMEKSVICSIMTGRAGDEVSHNQINSTHLLHWLKTWMDKEDRVQQNRIWYIFIMVTEEGRGWADFYFTFKLYLSIFLLILIVNI